jgi:hypothetical protein
MPRASLSLFLCLACTSNPSEDAGPRVDAGPRQAKAKAKAKAKGRAIVRTIP